MGMKELWASARGETPRPPNSPGSFSTDGVRQEATVPPWRSPSKLSTHGEERTCIVDLPFLFSLTFFPSWTSSLAGDDSPGPWLGQLLLAASHVLFTLFVAICEETMTMIAVSPHADDRPLLAGVGFLLDWRHASSAVLKICTWLVVVHSEWLTMYMYNNCILLNINIEHYYDDVLLSVITGLWTSLRICMNTQWDGQRLCFLKR